MPRFLRFKSVKSRLIFQFSAVALIPILIFISLEYRQRGLTIKENQFTKLKAIRDLKVREVNNWIDERIGDIRTASEAPAIRNITQAFFEGTAGSVDPGAIKNARELLNRYVRNYYHSFYELFIVNKADGKVIISSHSQMEGKDRSTYEYFTGALRERRYYIKDIYFSDAFHTPSMTFSIPIYELGGEQKITGVLVGRINLEKSLYKLLMNRTGLGKTGETLIVNRNNLALNELRWHPNAPLKLTITAEPASKAADKQTGIVESSDYRNVKVLAAYTYIPRTRWGFVAKQDLAEVYAPIEAMLTNLLFITIAVIVSILLMAFITAKAIARPVHEMTDVSKKIQQGDYSARNRITQPDEFGFLAQVFNDMTDSIKSQVYIQENSARIIREMVGPKTHNDFCRKVLRLLVETTGSHIGAFFVQTSLYNNGSPEMPGKIFQPLYSIGADTSALPSFKADLQGSEFGVAVTDLKITYSREIPEYTVFKFKTIAGNAIPREIVTIPVTIDYEVAAVISLASLNLYTRESKEIIENVWLTLNTAYSNLLGHINTEKMAEDLSEKNVEITAINEELRKNARKLEEQRLKLQQADRLKNEFLSNMSHELRTPLNSILSLSQLMLKTGTGISPEKETRNLEVIERNGRLLLKLISDILDLSKIESGRIDIIRSSFNIGEVMDTVLSTVTPMAKEKHLDIRLQVNDNPVLYSDRDKIRQILLNLLSNAVKFTAEGYVAVTVETAGDWVSIEVRDTGIGISPKDLTYIFDQFRQVDGSATRRYEGTGLGLAISRKLAHLLGGEINVNSKVGIGCVFTLKLPISNDFPKPDPTDFEEKQAGNRTSPVPAGQSGEPSGNLVLVVEDNKDNLFTICAVLDEGKYRCITAGDGETAIEAAQERLPDVILMDIQLPRMSGMEAVKQLRDDTVTSSIPVIALTARAMKEDIDEIMAAGFRDYLLKPIEITRLLETLKKWTD